MSHSFWVCPKEGPPNTCVQLWPHAYGICCSLARHVVSMQAKGLKIPSTIPSVSGYEMKIALLLLVSAAGGYKRKTRYTVGWARVSCRSTTMLLETRCNDRDGRIKKRKGWS